MTIFKRTDYLCLFLFGALKSWIWLPGLVLLRKNKLIGRLVTNLINN